MEQDIDDLLDEVETKFVKKLDRECPIKHPHEHKSKSAVKLRSGIDEAIDDILDLDVQHEPDLAQGANRTHVAVPGNAGAGRCEQTKRCFPVFLGGLAIPMGRGTSVNTCWMLFLMPNSPIYPHFSGWARINNVSACDQLRCTSCDFRVCHFDNLRWSRDTDYLFLRNNAPDFHKLKSRLTPKRGWRAYCCQCSWQNILDACVLDDLDLKWVCGKHES